MIIIETFERGSTPRYRAVATNRDQDRYVMITIPMSQIRKCRSASLVVDPPRRRSHKCTLAISTCAIDLHALKADSSTRRTYSCAATSSANALIASPAVTQLCRAQIPIAPAAPTACHFPRFRSLKAFGRRPRCKPHRRHGPASETLNKLGSEAMFAQCLDFPRKRPCSGHQGASQKCRQ